MARNLFRFSTGNVIGMIHVPALPGSPANTLSMGHILDKVESEAHIYKKCNVDGIIIENMHDTPYCLEKDLGPEITACMSVVGTKVRSITTETVPVGVQVLAAANRTALAVALASNLQFIRAEGFVFSHVADEGWVDGCAGPLLRYRRQIGAESVAILGDIKKKHSAHAVTADVGIGETAQAAAFFRCDGVIVTGTSTGAPASPSDLLQVQQAAPTLPAFIGSGITPDNFADFRSATGVIIGTYFKQNGRWENELDEDRIRNMVELSRQFKS